MASPTAMRHVIQILHYCVPFAVFFYYVCASIFGICMLQAETSKVYRKLRVAILSLMTAVVLTYVLEAVLIVVQIFSLPGIYSLKDYNIFALSSSLVWTVLAASIFESDSHQWYAYWGAWIIALTSETTITALSMGLVQPSSPMEWSQAFLQVFRLLGMSCLIAAYFSHSPGAIRMDEEETTPLLSQNRQQTATFRIADIDEAIAAEADREAVKKNQKERERLDKLNVRLEQEGSWFSYLREYYVFVPHLWPKNNPVLLVNLIGVGLCMLAERGLNILVPRQLGLVVTALGAEESRLFGILGLYVFLSWLNSYSGVLGLRQWLWLPVDANARLCMYKASYNQIMDLSCDFHDEKQSGELYTAMTQGNSLVDLLENVLTDFVPIMVDLVLALGYFYILFDSYLVLIGAATMISYFWGSVYLANVQVKAQRMSNVSYRKRHQVLYDTMGEWKTVSFFNRIPHAKKIYGASVSLWQKLWNKVRMLLYAGFGISNTILDLGSFAAFFFAAYQVYVGRADVGTFVTLVSYWHNFTMPIIMLARAHKDVLDHLVDAEELLSLYRRVPSIQDGPNEMQITHAKIVFEKVGFDYTGKKNIINDISFVAHPGQTVALIGETGAGKSTIIKLLFRFYDVTKGAIYIDSQDIRNVTLASLRDHIGVVPQDASLFNDTIKANLLYAKLDATEEEIQEACKAAAIHDKILQFPDGYSSRVGEKGVKLSGGELQRIAIARAILKDPKIILLDEATSSMDNETESKIQEGLKKLCKSRTTFVVAHRLSTIMEADMILVIKEGNIVEQGMPSDLLKKRGKYYHLWSKQMGIMDALAKSEDTLVDTSTAVSSPTELENAEDSKPVESTSENGQKAAAEAPPAKVSNSKKTQQRFRPEAPAFVPGSQADTNSSYGTIQQATSTQAKNQEAADGRSQTTKHPKRHKLTKSVGSQPEQQSDASTPDASCKEEETPLKDKGKGYGQLSPRRHAPSISDPGNLQSNQSEPSQTSSTHINRPSPRPPAARHVSAPSDTPAGLSAARSGNSGNQRRRRQRHWRNKANGGDPEESSSGPSGEWAGEQAAAPAPSPAEGAPNGGSSRVAGSAVRFAPGV